MIYLDNNATTRVDDAVLESMIKVMKEDYANASSTQHRQGRKANHHIETSRTQIAELLHISNKDIYFTSGATESINLIIKGIYHRYQQFGKHIITCTTEHKAVLESCRDLEKHGAEITYLPVDKRGQINLEELHHAIRPDTILVSIMSCNNETGILHPIASISEICRAKNTLLFCDMTQSIGKYTIDLDLVDFACFSAHKFHGPKGIGALYINHQGRTTTLDALLSGGSQEDGLRPGTYNTASIVGMAKALTIALSTDRATIRSLRDYLEEQLTIQIPHCYPTGCDVERVDNTTHLLIKYIRSSVLFTQLPNLALASGSACVTGDRDPSHVLKAMQFEDEDALSSIRFSLSKYTTKEEIDQSIHELVSTVKRLRDQSPTWLLHQAGLL